MFTYTTKVEVWVWNEDQTKLLPSKRIKRFEINPYDEEYKIIILTDDDERFVMTTCNTKDDALNIISDLFS